MTSPRTTALLPLALSFTLVAADGAAPPDRSPGQRRRELSKALPNGLSGPDRADLRRQAELDYRGGEPGPAYLALVERSAKAEATRWKTRAQLMAAGAAPASAALNAWVSLGPTANLVNTSYPDIDSGRPRTIVTHPTDPRILYMAMSGGGVWKATQADPNATDAWDWTPITDNLPAAGNLSIGALAMSPADPNILLVALGDPFDAPGKGAFHSADGGTTWTAATGLRNQTRTWDICHLDGNVVLMGGNDGLKRSTDGGLTWAPVTINGADNQGWVFSLARLSATEALVSLVMTDPVIGVNAGMIFRTVDAGATWTRATVTLPTFGVFPPYRLGRTTLAAAPSDPNTLYALPEIIQGTGQGMLRGGNGGMILVSKDRGLTWTYKEGYGLYNGEGVAMSSDGGQSFYNHLITVDPADANRVFVGTNMALWRSENGGQSWQQLTHWTADTRVYAHADFHSAAWSKTGTPRLFLGNDGGLAIVNNPRIPTAQVPTGSGGVASLTDFVDNRRNRGLSTHLLYNLGSTQALTPPDARSRLILGLQDNGTRMRMDDGQGLAGSGTFEPVLGGDGFGALIHPLDGNRMLGSLYYARIARTEDGTNFYYSYDGISEAGGSKAPFFTKLVHGLGDPTGDTVFTVTNSKVYISTAFGKKWRALPMTTGYAVSQTIRNMATSATQPSTLAIVCGTATAGKVYVTNDLGVTWVDKLWPAGAPGSASTIWIDTTNPSVMYVASASSDSTKLDRLWKTTNGGTSWAPLNGTLAAPNGFPYGVAVHVIKNDPTDAQVLYAGTDFGVYQSTNGGATWTRLGTGLPLVGVRDLWISPDGSLVRAASYGRGVWELRTGPSVLMLPQGWFWAPVNGSVSVTAMVTDSPGSQDVTWNATGGTFAAGTTAPGNWNTFYAPTVAGDYLVRATSAADQARTGTSVAKVYDPSTVTLGVAPASVVMMAGEARTFTATVSLGPVTWSASGGNLAANGTSAVFTAPATAGTFTVTAAAVLNPAKTASVSVKVRTRDLNGDGVINEADFAVLAAGYGLSAAAPGFNGAADLNEDGRVDDADIALFLNGL